jgi:hypothetical protein
MGFDGNSAGCGDPAGAAQVGFCVRHALLGEGGCDEDCFMEC